MKRKFDVDGYYNAIRPRLENLGGAGGLSTTVPPHTHHASTIVVDPEPVDALISGDDSQEVHQELGMEKLARSGEQLWLGPDPLNMAHFSILDCNDADIEGTATVGVDIAMTGANGLANITGVRDISFVGDVGEGVIDQPRVIHMMGDHTDDEAKVDGLERVVFNNEPTASSIESPSRLDMNIGVEAGVSYTAAEGRVSWDTLEDVLVAYVASGAGVVAIAFGWGAVIAANGFNPA